MSLMLASAEAARQTGVPGGGVLDDERWAAIAVPKQRSYGAQYEMDLPARDWPGLAAALRGWAAGAETIAEIGNAVRAALAGSKPAMVHIPVRSVVSPNVDYVTR